MTNVFYIILNTSEVTEEIINLSDNSDIGNLRKNSDGSKCVLQFSGSAPDLILGHDSYSADDMRNILTAEEWQPTSALNGAGGFWAWVWGE